jgi:hypothetical protein
VKRLVEFFQTEDGEPWGAFVYGHVDPSSVDRDIEAEINRSLEAGDIDLEHFADWTFDPAQVMHHWFNQEEDAAEDAPFYWCEAGDLGATPVTGVRF